MTSRVFFSVIFHYLYKLERTPALSEAFERGEEVWRDRSRRRKQHLLCKDHFTGIMETHAGLRCQDSSGNLHKLPPQHQRGDAGCCVLGASPAGRHRPDAGSRAVTGAWDGRGGERCGLMPRRGTEEGSLVLFWISLVTHVYWPLSPLSSRWRCSGEQASILKLLTFHGGEGCIINTDNVFSLP